MTIRHRIWIMLIVALTASLAAIPVGNSVDRSSASLAYCVDEPAQSTPLPKDSGRECVMDLRSLIVDYGKFILVDFLVTAGFLAFCWFVGWAIFRLAAIVKRGRSPQIPPGLRDSMVVSLMAIAGLTYFVAAYFLLVEFDFNRDEKYCDLSAAPSQYDFHSSSRRCRLSYVYFIERFATFLSGFSVVFQAPVWLIVFMLSLIPWKPSKIPK